MICRIASFNLQKFGDAARTENGRDLKRIADIILSEKFDIVALQEIFSMGRAVEDLLRKCFPSNWDLKVSEGNKCGEGFAYIWNTNRFRLSESTTAKGLRIFEPRAINSDGNDTSVFCGEFDRTPFYARFIPTNGGFFEIRLVNVHIHFGNNTRSEIAKRQEEYKLLVNGVYPGVSMNRRYGNNRVAYTIALGDYNLNLYKPRGGHEKNIVSDTYIKESVLVDNQKISTTQDELSTIKNDTYVDDGNGYSQNYDHFTYNVTMLEQYGIKCKPRRVDVVRKYFNGDFDLYRSEISDHVPIVLEMNII